MNDVQLGFDAHDRPIVGYTKYDSNGHTQIFLTRLEDGAWRRYVAMDWDRRWDIGGLGSIVPMIRFRPPVPCADGSLCLVFENRFLAAHVQAIFLDPDTLRPVSDPIRLYPEEMDTLDESERGEWQINFVGLDLEALASTGSISVLRWKSMRPNRDSPRERVPEPSTLELIELTL